MSIITCYKSSVYNIKVLKIYSRLFKLLHTGTFKLLPVLFLNRHFISNQFKFKCEDGL